MCFSIVQPAIATSRDIALERRRGYLLCERRQAPRAAASVGVPPLTAGARSRDNPVIAHHGGFEMETKQQTLESIATAPVTEGPRRFHQVLSTLVGKTVKIVNPESLEDAPLGHRLTANFYRAKVLALGDDYLRISTVYTKHSAKAEADREPVLQFIPIDRVKRVSFMKAETLLHI
jgi:hypothetical protein